MGSYDDAMESRLPPGDPRLGQPTTGTEWHEAAQAYLARLAGAEYRADRAAHIKAGRSPNTFRYNPSQYHRDLVELLGANDEEGFKARKMLEGYASAIGV